MQRKRNTLPPLVIGGLLLFFATAGCTSTRIASDKLEFDTINWHAEKRKARVTLKHGQWIEARNLRIRGDSISWANPRSGEITTVSMADVGEVRFTRHGEGAVEGAGIGFATGFLFVGGIAAASWSPCTGFCFLHPDSRSEAFVMGALFGGVLALPLGTLIGAGAGSKLKFEIRPPQVNEMPVVAAEDEGR